MSFARNEKAAIAPSVRHLPAAGILLAGLLFVLSLAAPSAHAQDVFSSGGSAVWDKAPVRGTGNPCQQAERLINGRWVTSQNGTCAGDDRNAPIIRPADLQPNVGNGGDSIVRPPDVSPPGADRRTNGYLGLTQQQAAKLRAQQGRINAGRNASIFNGLAKEKGIPTYKAGPQDSNVGQNFGFGQSGKSRNNNFSGYAGRGSVPNKGSNGTSYGRNYGGVQY